MKTMLLRTITVLAGVALLSGCASPDGNVKLGYLPARKSALSTLKPMVIALQVEDRRATGDRSQVGKRADGNIYSSKDVSQVVRDALKAELEKNGHRVAEGEAELADATVKVVLKSYFCDIISHFWNFEMSANFGAEVSVARPPGEAPRASQPLNGSHRSYEFALRDGVYQRALNKALAEFVRALAADPKVLEALRTGM